MTSHPEACDFALVTPPGRGGIAVIVVSGPAAGDVVSQIFKPWKSHTQDVENVLRLGSLVDEDGQTIDEAVICRRREGYEINIHGGPLVTKQATDLLSRLGARGCAFAFPPTSSPTLCSSLPLRKTPALEAPGIVSPQPHPDGLTDGSTNIQVTDGVIPSTQEGVVFNPAHPQWNNPAIGREMLELLPHARSELVVQALTSQWAGGVSRLVFEALAACHALDGDPECGMRSAECGVPAIDAQQPSGGISGENEFPNSPKACEQEIPHSAFRIPHLASDLRAAALGLAKMQCLLFPAEVVLVGPPNAGKSTLINALTGRAVSIVHERPGTTRDWVRELALLDGVPVYLTDTAGLWDQADGIDAQSVARARERALAGDVVLLCGAGQAPEVPAWLQEKRVLRLSLQADRFGDATPVANTTGQKGKPPAVRLSAQTGAGLAELKHAVIAALGLGGFDPRAPMAFSPRQGRLLERAAHCLDGASPSDLCDAVACLQACLWG